MSAAPSTTPVLSQEHLARLPMFPLRGACLFPGTLLPLHIFEPRYQEMVAHARAGQLPIAMAHITGAGPGDGPPEVHPVMGVGAIVHHQALPDGRCNLMLRGLARVELVREHAMKHRFREVEARLLPDEDPQPTVTQAQAQALRQVMQGLLRPLHRHDADAAAAVARLAALQVPAGPWSDLVAEALVREQGLRLGLMQERRVEARLDQLLTLGTELMAHLHRDEGGVVH
jgi:Lon protease-like protein